MTTYPNCLWRISHFGRRRWWTGLIELDQGIVITPQLPGSTTTSTSQRLSERLESGNGLEYGTCPSLCFLITLTRRHGFEPFSIKFASCCPAWKVTGLVFFAQPGCALRTTVCSVISHHLRKLSPLSTCSPSKGKDGRMCSYFDE